MRPVERALARAAARNAGNGLPIASSGKRRFFERVRSVYRARAAAEPNRIIVIDAALPVEEVAHRISSSSRRDHGFS